MATAAEQDRIDTGRVISRGFAAIREQFLSFAALAMLVVGLSVFLSQMLLPPVSGTADTFSSSVYVWLPLLVEFVALAFVQAVLVRSVILGLSGRPTDVGGSAVRALGLLPQLIGLTILTTIGVAIGFVLLIVPGIFLSILWVVAVPALVEERQGMIGSMKRSAELTEGARSPVFGLLVVWFLMSWGVSYATTSLGIGIAAGAGSLETWIVSGIQALGSAILTLINAAFVASLYVELRTAKEGATTDVLADIFA